ncbi:PEP-utilizing enzyme, partial [Clostridium sp. HCS.1]|uniref:PEP-utilizing enzyme n=1 Tax=Clostridium sp. HCS.1 TaxID=3238594 RepID=UPI003A10247E
HEKGESVFLVRLETSTEDIEGMIAAEGILTVRGGMTSHASVVARGMGTCCVAGCGTLKVNESTKTLEVNGKVYTDTDYISIDGSTGNVYGEAVATVTPEI